jgi:hypothetical protein
MIPSPLQFKRKLADTRKFELPSSIVIIEIPLFEKADPWINFTERGIQIDLSDEQYENADSAIRVSIDPDSNVNTASD